MSSTYEDLRDERDSVIQGILELGHIPVGMEMFSAADEQQWKIIARHIDESDHYIVLVAHRYGSMDGSISFTRKEYEYAVSRGIPTIGFIIDPSAPWPADKMDSDPALLELLGDFKKLVLSKPVGYWKDSRELYGLASVALVKTITAQPRTGWVRSNEINGAEVTAEIARLSSENARLRAQITELEAEKQRDSANELVELYAQMSGRKWEHAARFTRGGEWEEVAPISYSAVFMILAPNMVLEAPTDRIDNLLCLHSWRESDGEIGAAERETPIAIPVNSRNELLADFMMLDLMCPSSRRHQVSDKSEYWTLTDKGRELLKQRKRSNFSVGAE